MVLYFQVPLPLMGYKGFGVPSLLTYQSPPLLVHLVPHTFMNSNRHPRLRMILQHLQPFHFS